MMVRELSASVRPGIELVIVWFMYLLLKETESFIWHTILFDSLIIVITWKLCTCFALYIWGQYCACQGAVKPWLGAIEFVYHQYLFILMFINFMVLIDIAHFLYQIIRIYQLKTDSSSSTQPFNYVILGLVAIFVVTTNVQGLRGWGDGLFWMFWSM